MRAKTKNEKMSLPDPQKPIVPICEERCANSKHVPKCLKPGERPNAVCENCLAYWHIECRQAPDFAIYKGCGHKLVAQL